MYFNRKNAQQKNWRMIKKGKHFLFGCSLVFAIGATLAAPTVKADSVEGKPETTVPTSSESTGESTTYDAPAVTASVEKNTADVATVVSTETETAPSSPLVDKTKLEVALGQARAKSLDGQETSVKAEVEAAIAEAEALVANESVSQAEINQSVERLNKAVASVKEVTAVTTETPSEETTEVTSVSSTTTPKVRSRRALSEGNVRSVNEEDLKRAVVTKENFESFFQEGGNATYDKSTGTIKLTDDVSGQVGSAYLRFKINPGQPFTFTGKVDIGNKYEGKKVDNRPGGDGVGFVFHTGKVDTIGQSGASIGMGTITNAFGFKLDSWHNTSTPEAKNNASADPKYSNRRINGKFEWEQNAFGSFYSSNNAGRVTTSSSAAKSLNPAPSGQWVDFKIEYDRDKNFTVTYGSQTWTTNLSKANADIITPDAKRALTTGNPTFALSFLGSTGSGTNLQRVQIERFEFTAPQIVHMKFVDVNGNEIEASSAIPGDENEVVNLSTQDKKIAAVEAKGYKLKEIDSTKAPSYSKENNTVKLTPGGQLLTYVFEEKDTTAPDAPVVNPVKAGDEAITGKAEAGSTVEVTLPGGAKKSVTAGEDGTFSIPVSGLNENDEISVTATDASNNTSTPTTATVGKAADKTAPDAPVVNPVKAGDEAITGKAEAGSTVEVTLPDGSKATATADQDGNFSVPVSGLEEGKTVSVTATDASNNTSAPTTATVGKADDKTAPTAPSTKTPVKDTANLTDAEKAKVKEAVEAVNTGSKAEVSTLPNTGEKQSIVALGLAVLSALSGGLLVSKKRKEEE